MKNKYWILIFGVLFALCLAMALLPSLDAPAEMAQVKYGNSFLTVRLDEDQEFTIASDDGGYNIVTVKDGKIAVTEASCPDHYCMARGFCNSGTQIVCLPNRLVIEFLGEAEIDMVVG